jgi:hypothetical protein
MYRADNFWSVFIFYLFMRSFVLHSCHRIYALSLGS